jgi:hypothetical protein
MYEERGACRYRVLGGNVIASSVSIAQQTRLDLGFNTVTALLAIPYSSSVAREMLVYRR